nr:hypothetical protein [bacterium]
MRVCSTALSNWATEKGFSTASGAVYGLMEGYLVTAYEDGRRVISVGFAPPEKAESFARASEEAVLDGRLSEKYMRLRGAFVLVQGMRWTQKSQDELETFLQKTLAFLQAFGADGADHCWVCSEAVGQDAAHVIVSGAVQCVHPACRQTYAKQLEHAGRVFESENKHYGRGFVGALLGALVGTLAWVLVYLMGFLASPAAFLMTLAAGYGYQKLGGRLGKRTLMINAIAGFIGILISIGFSVIYAMVTGEMPITPSTLAYVLTMPSILKSMGVELGIGLAFGALGLLPIARQYRMARTNAGRRMEVLEQEN